jgi:hypothetical protein
MVRRLGEKLANKINFCGTELGTRIWQISNGVGQSPAIVPDPMNPSKCLSDCVEWCETTSLSDEGKVQQVAMDTKNAWYLTDRGVKMIELNWIFDHFKFTDFPPNGPTRHGRNWHFL